MSAVSAGRLGGYPLPGVLDSGTQQATRRVGTLRMVPVTGDELSVRTGRIVMVRSFEVQT